MKNWYFPTYNALVAHFKHDQQMLKNIKKWQMELLNTLRALRTEQTRLNLELTGKEKTYGLAKLYTLAGEKAEQEGNFEQAEKFYEKSIDIPRAPTVPVEAATALTCPCENYISTKTDQRGFFGPIR